VLTAAVTQGCLIKGREGFESCKVWF